jgi:hypothetical protein
MPPAPEPAEARRDRDRPTPAGWFARIALAVLAVAYSAIHFTLVRAKWDGFDVAQFDLGPFCSLLEGVFYPGMPYSDPNYPFVWFYCPFTLLYFPIYAATRSVVVLIAYHTAINTAILLVLYLLGRRVFRSPPAALAFPFLWAMNPLSAALALLGLRFENLFILLLLAAWYCLETGRVRATKGLALLACLVKIDVAPVLLIAGALLLLRRRRIGKTFLAVGLAFPAIIVTAAFLYSTATGGLPRWDQFHAGNSLLPLGEYVRIAGRHALALGQWMFLPLLAPEVLLLGAVNFVYLVVSTPAFNRIPEARELLVFSSSLVPQVHSALSVLLGVYFLAFVVGVRRLLDAARRLAGDRAGLTRAVESAVALILVAAGVFVYRAYTPRELGPVPFTPDFDATYYCETKRSATGWATIAALPRDQQGVMDFVGYQRAFRLPLAQRVFDGTIRPRDFRYAWFDLSRPAPDLSADVRPAWVRAFLTDGDFRVTTFENDILVLTRGPAGERRAPGAAEREALARVTEVDARTRRRADVGGDGPVDCACTTGVLRLLCLGSARGVGR